MIVSSLDQIEKAEPEIMSGQLFGQASQLKECSVPGSFTSLDQTGEPEIRFGQLLEQASQL